MKRGGLYAAAAVLLLALAGCATPPHRAGEPLTPQQLRLRLQSLDSFGLQGRLAASTADEGFNASLAWVQKSARSEVDLRAPLGFGSAKVVLDTGTIAFTSSRGDRLAGAAAATELNRRVGFEVPLQSLRYWVLGVADPSGPAVENLGDTGQLAGLTQFGWQIDYAEYRGTTGSQPISMPRRITLLQGQTRLRLVVDRWQLGF